MCGWSEPMERMKSLMPWRGSNRMSQAFAETLSKQAFLRAVMRGLVVAVALLSPAICSAAINAESSSYYDEARAYLKKGDLNAAAIQLKNAIRADENNVEARFDLASIYLARRDGSNAETELRAALAHGIVARARAATAGPGAAPSKQD